MFICTKEPGQTIDDRMKLYEDHKRMVDWAYGRDPDTKVVSDKPQERVKIRQSTE